jgi:hypothetical protein
LTDGDRWKALSPDVCLPLLGFDVFATGVGVAAAVPVRRIASWRPRAAYQYSFRHARRGASADWRNAAIAGVLLPPAAMHSSWAEQVPASGVASVLS